MLQAPPAGGQARVAVVIASIAPMLSRAVCGLLADAGVEVLQTGVHSDVLGAALTLSSPNVVIVDEGVGHPALCRLRTTMPGLGILLIANEPADLFGRLVVAAGASCVDVTTPERAFLEAVQATARGERVFVSPRGPSRRAFEDPAASLTRREREVLALLRSDLSYDEVAFRLTISLETAKTHGKNIYRKLGVHSKASLQDAADRWA